MRAYDNVCLHSFRNRFLNDWHLQHETLLYHTPNYTLSGLYTIRIIMVLHISQNNGAPEERNVQMQIFVQRFAYDKRQWISSSVQHVLKPAGTMVPGMSVAQHYIGRNT